MKYKAEELKEITKAKCDAVRNKRIAYKNLEYEEYLKSDSFEKDILVVEKSIEDTLQKEEPCAVYIERDKLSSAGFVSRYLKEEGFRIGAFFDSYIVFYLN